LARTLIGGVLKYKNQQNYIVNFHTVHYALSIR